MEIVKNPEMTNLENPNEVPLTIPLEKFPYLQTVRESINKMKDMIDLLNKRKKLIENSQEDLTPFEKNERAILMYRTDRELATLHTNMIQQEKHFVNVLNNATDCMKEMETKWDILMEKAKKAARNGDKEVEKILTEANGQKFDDDWNLKINHYLSLKSLIYPNKQPIDGKTKLNKA